MSKVTLIWAGSLWVVKFYRRGFMWLAVCGVAKPTPRMLRKLSRVWHKDCRAHRDPERATPHIKLRYN